MRVYFVRHGQAFPESENPRRPLTEKGKRDAEIIAGFLKKNSVMVESVICSTKTRARETAQIIAGGMAAKPIILPREGLSPNDPVAPLREELETLQSDVMVVGHLPYLNELSALLLTGKDNFPVYCPTCAVICLERISPGRWQLLFMVSPEWL